ncbi:MAG: YCF48-related protein [Planctomycetes bacterium]|nr:YCF48-related protein [Planctomycetota bacterium]
MDSFGEARRGTSLRPRQLLRSWTAILLASSLNLIVLQAALADEATPTPRTRQVVAQAAQQLAIVESLRHDASFADVCFVDRASGWAVGDRGVIWRTQDGGATWQQQASGVTCRLSSVFFADKRRGWAVGGEFEPYTAATRGVVLRTDDGGDTWKSIPRLMLPSLARVKFFDGRRGIAIGAASSIHPSGVFVTQDAGDTWQPMPADRTGGWLAGDFLDEDSGAVAGTAGRFATIARRQIVSSSLVVDSLRSHHAMRLISPIGGWIVGDGGLVLTTKDLGHSWQSPPGELPEFASDHFDFHALAVIGPQVWIAGSPGTRVFISPDAGQTWQAFPTGQSTPLRAITFVDAECGWAVGDLGNILATDDGGRSWKPQRSGGWRAALLGLLAEATDVPLELLADYGAAEGYIAAVEILHTATYSDSASEHFAQQRNHEALLLAGAAAANSAWRFPLPPRELSHSPADLLAELNRASDGHAIEQIERQLVRAIRMWRPDIVVTHNTKLETCEPRAAILAALIQQSINAAADPARHGELASDVGLAPWQVKKTYGLLPSATQGAEAIAINRFSPWLGTTLANFVAPARQTLGAASAPPEQLQLALLGNSLQGGGSRGIFHGTSLSPGSEARRPQPELPVNDLAELRKLADRRRHLASLLERTEGNAVWAAHVGELTDGLNANDGGELLAQLADGYRAASRLDLAADTYFLLSRRYPDHPLADRALLWLVQFYASSEAAHRSGSRGSRNVRQAAMEFADSVEDRRGLAHFAESSEQNVPVPLPEYGSGIGSKAGVTQASAIAPGVDSSPAIGLSRDDRLRRAIQLAEYLHSARPELYAEPRIRFAEVAAQRQLGFTNPARRYFLTLRQLPENNPWRCLAETENWLAQPADLPPSAALGACRPTHNRPRLDAKFDEPFWDAADRLPLRSNSDSPPRSGEGLGEGRPTAEVRFAFDQQYLYAAIHCPKAAGVEYKDDDRPRPRDADLTQHDRVTLRFDTDRDFTTAFELTVDARGWTHEACWGDARWNPDWFVAAGGNDESWTVEAAVPLAELVSEPLAARHVWAASACRTIPRTGFQSWTGNAADDSPAQFGFLIFE